MLSRFDTIPEEYVPTYAFLYVCVHAFVFYLILFSKKNEQGLCSFSR